MSIAEFRDEDQERLRKYCVDVLDGDAAIKDKNHAAKLLAWLQNLIQKNVDNKGGKEEEVDDRELTDEELDAIKGLVANGESK